jgi:hypothetical protein
MELSKFPPLSFPSLEPRLGPLFEPYKSVNRVIIIGNGFDLAHGIESSFSQFICDYAVRLVGRLLKENMYADDFVKISRRSGSSLHRIPQTLVNKEVAYHFLMELFESGDYKVVEFPSFLLNVMRELSEKKWVDIELSYFDQLKQLDDLRDIEQVMKINKEFNYVKNKLITYLRLEVINRGTVLQHIGILDQFKELIKLNETKPNTITKDEKPDKTCVLNFNYTNIARLYADSINATYIPIHGQLEGDDKEIQAPIFGYGDELDKEYMEFELHRNDGLFEHIKSFKYLQYKYYRAFIDFIESAPYQVQIFGHSCGLSDRTLLNTVFEHENCISIKPFYYEKDGRDDYEQKSIAIARHFRSKSDFLIKVVNKKYCEPMFQPILA